MIHSLTSEIMCDPNKNRIAGINLCFASVYITEILRIHEDTVPENTQKVFEG